MCQLSQAMDVVPTWTGEPGARCFECGSLVIRGGVWVDGDTVFCICPTCAKAGAPKLMAAIVDALGEYRPAGYNIEETVAAMRANMLRALLHPLSADELRGERKGDEAQE